MKVFNDNNGSTLSFPYALKNNLLNSNWGHFAWYSIMYNILNCNGLLLQMYTSNDSLKDTYDSTIQVAAPAKPLFIHSEIKIYSSII